MRKRRILWALAGILAAVCYLFENNPGTLTLLVGVLVLPAFGTITLAGGGVDAALSIPRTVKKGETISVGLELRNRSFLPKGRLELRLSCRNLHTGEEQEAVQVMSLAARKQEQFHFELTCPYAGRVEVRVCSLRWMDPFGLFARQVEISAQGSVTVLPQGFPCALVLMEEEPASADREAFAPNRPGNDPGENFGLREYMPGDAVRRIHWKLSEKVDQLMVRELGQPMAREIALLLDRSGEPCATETDAETEILISLSTALAEEKISHSVFWLEENETLAEFFIREEEDLDEMVRELLALPPRQEGALAAALSQRERFAHVVLVSHRLPEIDGLTAQSGRVSLLIPSGLAQEGLQPDGSYVLSYEPGRYAGALCRVEV